MGARCLSANYWTPALTRGMSLCLDACVQELIQYLAVLDYAAAQPALQHVPGLLQHPARIGIAGVRLGMDSYQRKPFKGVFGNLPAPLVNTPLPQCGSPNQ